MQGVDPNLVMVDQIARVVISEAIKTVVFMLGLYFTLKLVFRGYSVRKSK